MDTCTSKAKPEISPEALTFCRFVFDGLLEESDVLKSAKEQNHLVVFIPYGSHLHVEPHWASCRDIFKIPAVWIMSSSLKQGFLSLYLQSNLYICIKPTHTLHLKKFKRMYKRIGTKPNNGIYLPISKNIWNACDYSCSQWLNKHCKFTLLRHRLPRVQV